MDARRIYRILGSATVFTLLFTAQAIAQFGPDQQHVAQSQNFIVFAANPQLAAQVSQSAEEYRSKLAMYWLSRAMYE